MTTSKHKATPDLVIGPLSDGCDVCGCDQGGKCYCVAPGIPGKEGDTDLLLDVWLQFSTPVPNHPDLSHDCGLSTLTEVACALVNRGVLELADLEHDWYREVKP